MMADIVRRLRSRILIDALQRSEGRDDHIISRLIDERECAASEIERLRAALENICRLDPSPMGVTHIATQALNGRHE